jgi:uncharacterized glyoxalase superfamily protein PhnB
MSAKRFMAVAPCFAVADVGATMRWYEEHLGFTGHHFPNTEPYAFCVLSYERIEIMLQRVEGYVKPNLYELRDSGVWDVYIRMQGVKEFYQSAREHLEILKPLEKQFYGDWEFEVKDPNGYVLVFSELTD